MVAVALRRLTAATAALAAAAAQAHDVAGAPLAAVSWDLPWTFEPWVIGCLALSVGGYLLGLSRLWCHAGRGRGVGVLPSVAFVAGWAFLVLALVSPLDALGGQLFSAHMVQHELLMVLVAPLMVLGRPLAVWAWALPAGWRRHVGAVFHHPWWRKPWKLLTAPLCAWTVHAAALWLWHVPAWFEAALSSNLVHTWQHISFLFSALLFWWSALGQVARPARAAAMAYLFTTMLHTSALGALLTLSPVVWYPSYLSTTLVLGWDALQDQQLGGLVMWVPAGLAYLATGLALAAQLLRAEGLPVRQTAA